MGDEENTQTSVEETQTDVQVEESVNTESEAPAENADNSVEVPQDAPAEETQADETGDDSSNEENLG